MSDNKRVVLGDISLNKTAVNEQVKNGGKKKKKAAKKEKLSSSKTKQEEAPSTIVPVKTKEKNACKVINGLAVNKAAISTIKNKPMLALYIGGLGKSINSKTLIETFKDFLSLQSAKVCYDSLTGDSLGYGYLNFTSQKELDKFVDKYNYKRMLGGEIKLMPSLRNSVYRKNIGTNVFFSNLPLHNSGLSTRRFYDIFKKYGKILSCKLDARKNIGFVYFEDDKAATKVINDFNNTDFYGNKIVCGLHFDKDLRNYPGFEKRKAVLTGNVVIENELAALDKETAVPKNKAPHPNAVFVKNLPVDVTTDELLDYFSQFGPVKSVYTSRTTQHTSEWAFITYKWQKDAQKLLDDFPTVEFRGRTVTVARAKLKSKEPEKLISLKPTVVLENIGSICTNEFLSRICDVANVHFEDMVITGYDNETASFDGYLTFKSIKEAMKAQKFLDKKLVGGNTLSAKLGHFDKSSFSHNFLADGITTKMINSVNRYLVNNPNHKKDRQNKPNAPPDCRCMDDICEHLEKKISQMVKSFKPNITLTHASIKCVAEYIIDSFWLGDATNLDSFLTIANTNIHFDQILIRQIEIATKTLGILKQ
ncbi:Mip6p KNAG_0I01590 [Huiozyma naganishii CBS 8797]|uniref:RRM domain-containing protein n=1 Tax=Huiozyma naganishii (strain ATCC MYA-139 / BCRC 22969 / CBS 8797 / KCTC 17520 / NBRC 10181 / NCYC 3082 / Yp74L-3) TaxID=1071383 RepID=J7SA66_HUIN7|nr:hypothetical protein KNAG_0I01590 [Kazachstania naganishii CBS 8797]CCK71946.1 hypothetical protein KNAG_0I01590 [Kazachstania naganishii CBS 8797]